MVVTPLIKDQRSFERRRYDNGYFGTQSQVIFRDQWVVGLLLFGV